MQKIQQSFQVNFSYPVIFSENIFSIENLDLKTCFENYITSNSKILVAIDFTFLNFHKYIFQDLKNYFLFYFKDIKIIDNYIEIEGGEKSKNNAEIVNTIIESVHLNAIDRHSFIFVLGGGSVIDTVGFAAAIAHRGIRLVRIPTTTLAQNDAAIGVKNGVNTFGKKNFTGTFAPPFAVINDFNFLTTLNDRDWRCGIAEAIKVALIKDKLFFDNIKNDSVYLANRNMESMQKLIIRCADLHLQHIAGGDAFEQGSARPLDFGHWSAHKLEYLSDFELRHGEAVAIGIALDCIYSYLIQNISLENLQTILNTLIAVGFDIFSPLLELKDEKNSYLIINGLQEFREHLGGKLTITLLKEIGLGIETNYLENGIILEAILFLKNYNK